MEECRGREYGTNRMKEEDLTADQLNEEEKNNQQEGNECENLFMKEIELRRREEKQKKMRISSHPFTLSPS